MYVYWLRVVPAKVPSSLPPPPPPTYIICNNSKGNCYFGLCVGSPFVIAQKSDIGQVTAVTNVLPAHTNTDLSQVRFKGEL